MIIASFFVFKNTKKRINLHKIKKTEIARSIIPYYKNTIKESTKHVLQVRNSVAPIVFNEQKVEDIALITMIKDEEDIIYENLVWYFCICFRKFVIVDNEYTDKTRMLVNKFKKETREKAQIIIIDDPITKYIQSAVTTAAMISSLSHLANSKIDISSRWG